MHSCPKPWVKKTKHTRTPAPSPPPLSKQTQLPHMQTCTLEQHNPQARGSKHTHPRNSQMGTTAFKTPAVMKKEAGVSCFFLSAMMASRSKSSFLAALPIVFCLFCLLGRRNTNTTQQINGERETRSEVERERCGRNSGLEKQGAFIGMANSVHFETGVQTPAHHGGYHTKQKRVRSITNVASATYKGTPITHPPQSIKVRLASAVLVGCRSPALSEADPEDDEEQSGAIGISLSIRLPPLPTTPCQDTHRKKKKKKRQKEAMAGQR